MLAPSIGLVTYSVPHSITNIVDDAVIQETRRLYYRVSHSSFIRCLRCLPLPSFLKLQALTYREQGRQERIQELRTFLLSMSDQIVVSEVAILVAVWARNGSITLYSTNVVIALATLASSVHIPALLVATVSNSRHRSTLLPRVTLMVFGAVSLIVLWILRMFPSWNMETHIYFSCAIRDMSPPRGSALEMWDLILANIVPAIFIGYAHLMAIYLLWRSDSAPRSSLNPEKHSTWTSLSSCVRTNSLRRRALYAYLAQRKSLRKLGPAARIFKLAESWAFHECLDSFIIRISWLLSASSYGVTTIFIARKDQTGMISGDPDEMGFGQIVPLILLLLPILTAIQCRLGML